MKNLYGTLSVLFLSILLFTASAEAKTVNLTDFGAIANDNGNDSAALQAAGNDVIAAGGGTIVFPAGKTDLRAGVYLDGKYISLRFVGDKGAEVGIGADGATVFFLGNLNQVLFEDLIFTGNNGGNSNDAQRLIYSSYVDQTTIRDCQFFGLAFGHALVNTSFTDLLIENSLFGGNRAGTALIYAENYLGLTIRNTNFIDYGNYRGILWSKTVFGGSPWIKTRNPAPETGRTNASSAYPVKLENTRLDEGPCIAVDIDNASFVDISSTGVNVSSEAGCIGIKLNRVTHAQISQSTFGWAITDQPFLRVTNSKNVDLKGISLLRSVRTYETDASKVNVLYCELCRLRRIQ